MNWPSIRNFPISAKTLIAVYTVLMGAVLVVALALSSWHHGLLTEKATAKPHAAEPAVSKAMTPPKADDGESSGVVIEPDPVNTIKVKTDDWFVYENFKLGHTHLNGQSLVYFSLMLLFLMSTASERSKTAWGVIFAVAVVLHTFGLFFMHKETFALLLRISGGLLSLAILVMCAYIFVDTLKKPLSS